jgi:uncharacterized protein (DUF488 family)
METPEFEAGLAEHLALARAPTAIMCVESVPSRCHRQLIADALLARGVDVRHVTGTGAAAVHRLTSFARLDGTRVIYDRVQLPLR